MTGGNTPYPFSGVFDGRGYTISGLKIGSEDKPSDYRYAGLFQYLLGAIVKDLKFTDAKIYTKTNDDKRYYAGVLSAAAEAEGTNGYIDSVYIDNAYVNGWKAFYAPKQFYKNNSHLILNTNASIPLGKNFNPETDAARDEDGNLIVF